MNRNRHFIHYAKTRPGQLASLAEILAVFFVGSMLSSVLFQLAGIQGHPLMALTGEAPDLFAISRDLFDILMLQNAGWWVLILLFGWAFRRSFVADMGGSLRGHSLLWLVGLGCVGWALGDLPNKVLWVLDAEFDLGTSVPWREALIHGEKTAGWWTLMAVGSFGLIPVVEEIFWRGFVQARLQHSFPPAVAIIGAAAMFTLSHAQYHQLDGYHVATILALFFNACVIGWLFYRSGSLVPVIVMHALLNFPTDGAMTYVVIAVMSVIVCWQWTAIKRQGKEAAALLKGNVYTATAITTVLLLALSMMALSQAPGAIMYIGAIALGLLILLWGHYQWRVLPALRIQQESV
ncbi:CPBP family intramembrane metalloprotease [Aestuariibacter halophilus]|uniref:CPBP family intramembrane metalloprotease n=1 Tax=Fluctibacter halophilus TaxID=226011 RepID=A0ABS8G9V1_9ALTE|nr:CPBP family intramembrane glutamic endopeptidase [Aestuariibacter halophilus]MCC2617288.1 CPBP family intramembrane metalloprotease [Aestuariibacter halophilus]